MPGLGGIGRIGRASTALGEGVVDIITSIFADGTDGFYFDFSKTARLFQATTGGSAADDPGENIALALDGSRLDGRGIVNLVPYSAQFDNATWTKSGVTVTANATAAPDGTTTADLVLPSASASTFKSVRTGALGAASAAIVSVYVKPAGYNFLSLTCDNSVGRLTINVTTGATTVYAGTMTATSASVGGGWYRVTITVPNMISAAAVWFGPADVQRDPANSWAGDGTSGLYLWGAQVEVGSVATTYQANGATVGGPGNHGLQATTAAQPKYQTGGLARFDGLDDNLLSALVPGTAMTYLFKAKPNSSAAVRILAGSNDATNQARSLLGFDAGGLFTGGVGSQTVTTIKGSTNWNGLTGVFGLVYDGSTVKLYENAAVSYSAAQAGTPNGTIAIPVGGQNANGTLATFFGGDIYHALAIKKALTAAQIAAITNKWGTT